MCLEWYLRYICVAFNSKYPFYFKQKKKKVQLQKPSPLGDKGKYLKLQKRKWSGILNYYLPVFKRTEIDAKTHYSLYSLLWLFLRWRDDLLGVVNPQRGFCLGGLGAGLQGQWYLKKGGKSLK